MIKWKKLILTILICLISLTSLAYERKINDDSILKQLTIYNVKYPKIALAQAKLESANYRSVLFRTQNNLFGIVWTNKRETTGLRRLHHKYARYIDYTESVHDYALYQATFIDNISTEREYLKYLSRHYAADKNYIKKLRKIINKL